MTITPNLFEAQLKCPAKRWLQATGEPPTGNTFAEGVKSQTETCRAAETERPPALVAADVRRLKLSIPHSAFRIPRLK
jgi:hypothetical protein